MTWLARWQLKREIRALQRDRDRRAALLSPPIPLTRVRRVSTWRRITAALKGWCS